LAGPVVAAAVILPEGYENDLISDSKALSASARERAFSSIIRDALACAVAEATVEEIDSLNILRASLLAMRRAVEALSVPADHLLVDGIHPVPLPLSQETLVDGDARCLSVAAASILAKVTRDRAMADLDRLYPDYGFARHKGYPTKAHKAAVVRFGPSPVHRRSFRGAGFK
jgi:ribonuclease HII